ncbi:MAG: GPW/gp25 family protein [Chitinophagaceae bacterium]|nr:GPW/gp25 family protein [Chitinophagaceae bacterium]
MNIDNNFIGKGWAFPPKFNVVDNSTTMVESVEDINQSLYILFTTELGERVMQPDYGSALKTMIFEGMNEHFLSYMRMVLTRSILLYEARIKPLTIDFSIDENDASLFTMHLSYIVISTNQRNNFVFPYYINQ